MNVIFLSIIFGIAFMLKSVITKQRGGEAFGLFIALGLLLIGNIIEHSSIGIVISPFAQTDLQHWIHIDSIVLNAELLVLVCVIVYFIFMEKTIHNNIYAAEMIALIFFSIVGISLMLCFNNLLTVFLAIEIFSLPQYILAGTQKHNLKSVEAAFKYFIMGAFFSAILLLGIVFMYGFLGTFAVTPIELLNLTMELNPMLFYLGLTFILVAGLFKAGIVPFHFWVADVYTGSPSVLVPFMGGIGKIGTFILLVRLFSLYEIYAMPSGAFWVSLISILIIISLFVSNFTAIRQTNHKRMLAYSSIAQGGFMLFALLDSDAKSLDGLFVFLLGYCLALIGVFSVLNDLELKNTDGTVQWEGLAKRNPIKSAMLTVCLLSLAGLPGTAGFLGKFYMLSIGATYEYVLLIVLAAVFSVVSLYYYFSIIKKVYFATPLELDKKDKIQDYKLDWIGKFKYVGLIVLIILIGLGFMPLFH